jgi:glycosyltransferase involved in cell wall biosynthesis
VGEAGLLFDPTDVAGMADVMRRLARDEGLRKTLAKRGHARVLEFSPGNFVRSIADAYEFAVNSYRAKQKAA